MTSSEDILNTGKYSSVNGSYALISPCAGASLRGRYEPSRNGHILAGMNEPTELATPALSVGMLIGRQRARAEHSLQCLLEQPEPLEILVGDLTPGEGPLRGFADPCVRVIELENHHMGSGMARLVEEARAPLIALIEDHCYAAPGWAAGVLRAFARPEVAIVSYAIRDAGPETWLTRSFLFTEYGRWMDPAREGPVAIAALNNVAYRRSVLLRKTDLPRRMEGAHALHREIQREGGVAWLAADAIAAHQDWLSFLEGCRANGILKRAYAGSKVQEGLGWPGRLVHAAAMLLAPALHLGRLGWSVRNRPRLWTTFFTSLPVSVPVYVYASYQEALGYLFGVGTSLDDFVEMEVDTARSSER